MIESALDSNYRAIINELCPELTSSKTGEPLHCKKLPFLRNIITVGYVQQGCLTFEEAMKRADSVTEEKLDSMAQHVKPDDVKAVTVNVLHHRLNLTGEAKIRKENTDSIITSLMLSVKVPME